MSRILVIDDSLSALQVTEMILSEAGHEARTCSSPKHALEVLESEPFDLIVTDIYMPEMDGLEVILEERRIRPDVPILAISGMTGARNMLKVAKQLGACQVVQKPFSKADLLDAIDAALRARHPGSHR
jgi:CheY-like chemotaxis protein